MNRFLDTNVLVRHFTGDPPGQARRATRFLAESDNLIVADLILAELVYVLESFYRVNRTEVAQMARSVVDFPAVEVADPDLFHRTIEIYEIERLDFADAYLVASAERAGVEEIVSFDRGIDRVGTVRRLEPPRL